MRIGILTFHDEFNYGAFAQTYALQEVLRNYNCEVEIINYKSRHALTQQYWGLRSKDPRKLFPNVKKAFGFAKDHRSLNLSARVSTRAALSKLQYDVVFIGSDSVWCFSAPNIGFDTVYFSDGINAKHLVSYAPSFGPDAGRKDFPAMLPDLLRAFDSVSVRDVKSQNYFYELTGKHAQLVLDPTLMHPFTLGAWRPEEQDYIAVYGVDFTEQAQQEIVAWAKNISMPLISLGYRLPWADKNRIGVSPSQWMSYIENAKFVITSMFHGTLLSICYQRPFYTFVSPYRHVKLHDILSRLNLLDRSSLSDITLREAFTEPVDYESVGMTLEKERKKSLSFIEKNLNLT